MAFTPIYLTQDGVKNWLYGKVDFGTDPTISITSDFLNTLIVYAESEVSRRLSRFFIVPFVSLTTGTYVGLPQNTRAAIERLMTLLAVMYVLDVDFAQKSTNIAENYRKLLADQYYATLNSYLKRDDTGRFGAAQLADLKINPLYYTGLTVVPAPTAVDLFAGAGDNLNYAVHQITKPFATWWQFFPYGQANSGAPCNNII